MSAVSRRRRTTTPAAGPRFLRTHAWLLAVLTAVFFLTTDDRHVGQIADGRQMIWTAVAIAETGEIGQARGRDLAYPRGQDAVSRFGVAMSFAQVPAAWLAPAVEDRFGAGSSQPIFLVAPFIFVMAAAIFAGLAARELGAQLPGQRIAIALTAVGSPLVAYVALDLSEPLQAAALAGAFAAALAASRPASRFSTAPATRLAWCAGCAVGIATLTKSSLLAVAPLALLPLLTLGAAAGQRRRLTIWAAVGLSLPLAIWATFDLLRFGRLFGGYAGESFSHPWTDGFWRLLVGPNTGLLLFFPAAVLVPIVAWRARRSHDHRLAIGAISALGVLGGLIAISAGWWAWYGIHGWGPRLIVPAIPLLACVAAVQIAQWRSVAVASALALSIVLNLAPLLQHPVPVTNFRLACAWPRATAAGAARVPAFARRTKDGESRVLPDQILATTATASPFVTLPWFHLATRGSTDEALRRLASPPWIRERPDIAPPPLTAERVRSFTRTPGWRWWGRGFWPDAADAGYGNVYDTALANQVLRAQQMGRADLALALSMKLVRLAPRGFHDALLLESYRLLHRPADAASWLSSRPRADRAHPAINVVLALFERDAGNEASARALLSSSVEAFRGSPVARALQQPLSAWPADFASMTADDSLEVQPRQFK